MIYCPGLYILLMCVDRCQDGWEGWHKVISHNVHPICPIMVMQALADTKYSNGYQIYYNKYLLGHHEVELDNL